jgi:hypothetical protein
MGSQTAPQFKQLEVKLLMSTKTSGRLQSLSCQLIMAQVISDVGVQKAAETMAQ